MEGGGGVGTAACGVGIAYFGPSVGQVASATGPTIIGPAVILAPISVATGAVQN